MTGRYGIAASIACLAWPVGAAAQATPATEPSVAEETARALAEAVTERAAESIEAETGRDLAAWAESVIGRALSEAGATAGAGWASVEAYAPAVARGAAAAEVPPAGGPATGPAPVGLPSAGVASGGLPSAGPEVIVFMSLSVPEPSWREWLREADRIGAAVVLRGVVPEGFAATVAAIRARQDGDGVGAAIDPRLFRLFRIARAPAVAVVPGGVPPCTTPGCSADPPPPHDLVTGNIGLDGALEAIAREGGPGRDTARGLLERLRGETW